MIKEYIRTLKSLIADFVRDKQPEDVGYYQQVTDWLDSISEKSELHTAFDELHHKIVNEVIQFCKEYNLDVDKFSIIADGLLNSRDFGKWGPGTDSSMAMWQENRDKPFLYEI